MTEPQVATPVSDISEPPHSKPGPDFLHLTVAEAQVLERPGKHSTQIVSRRNAPDAHVTMTRVVMQPGAVSPPHKHEAAEQTWLVEHGRGRLLTSSYVSAVLSAGDVLITRAGETHGLEVLGDEPFVYLTVTTPPEDMTGFYDAKEEKANA